MVPSCLLLAMHCASGFPEPAGEGLLDEAPALMWEEGNASYPVMHSSSGRVSFHLTPCAIHSKNPWTENTRGWALLSQGWPAEGTSTPTSVSLVSPQ